MKIEKMKKLALILCLFAGLLIPIKAASRSKADHKPFNVLLITIDTLRPDRLSCYSREHLKTPNMKAFAEKGVLFSHAFAHTSTTLPSHTNIMLGTTPLYHGVHENSNFIVQKEFLTLAELLKQNGYSTGAFVGSYSLDSRFGLNQGFDVYDGHYDRSEFKRFANLERKAGAVVTSALGWLRDQSSPWFLWVHCFDPHTPYDPPEPYKTQYAGRLYDGEVAYVDHVLGELFRFLQTHHDDENTLIIFTGDHGESLGQHGEKTHAFYAYNSTIWIPLIIRAPGVKPRTVDQYACHTDIFPTVCDVLGIKKPSFLQGTSLLPAFNGKKLPKRSIYFESLYPYYTRGWAPIRGLMTGKDKYVESPIPELYDLKKDFNENINLAGKKKLDKYRKQLKTLMVKFSSPESTKAKQRFDRKAVEKLSSLGYVSANLTSQKKNFGPKDDVKTLLPYSNKAADALDLVKEGKAEDGIRMLKEVLTKRDDIATAYKNLSDTYKMTGRLQDSYSVLQLAIKKVPSSYLIFFSSLDRLLDLGRYNEVIRLFKEKNYRQMEYDPEIWNILGIAHYRMGMLDKAVDAYRQALLIDSRAPVVYTNLGEVLFLQSLQKKDQKKFQDAVDNFRQAIKIAPKYPLPYNDLGKAMRYTGDLKRAIPLFKKALELKPEFDEALYFLSLSYLETGNKGKALDSFMRYKNKYYRKLSPDQKKKLDALIRKCK